MGKKRESSVAAARVEARRLVLVHLAVLEDGGHSRQSLVWEAAGLKVLGREGELPGFEHEGREVVSVGLEVKVAEHGVGAPPSEELDVLLGEASAQEGGGPARAK